MNNLGNELLAQSLVPASLPCDKPSNTEVPVCLAYNQVHYETLVPNTIEDVQKII
jgi:hypothetical protein